MYASNLGACACVRAPCDCPGGSIDFGTPPNALDEWGGLPTTGDFSRLDRGQVDTPGTLPAPVLDRSATLGDLATLGSVLSLLFILGEVSGHHG